MVVITDSTIEIIKRYVEELEKNRIHVMEAILFGSYAKREEGSESDIDVTLISDDFTGDRFQDRRKIVPFRRLVEWMEKEGGKKTELSPSVPQIVSRA